MPTRILVAYTTNSGSTADVAQAIAEELGKTGAAVEARRLEEVNDLSPYQGVVVGGPMILGWHRQAQGFIKKHRQALQQVPVAYFITAMSLTQTGETQVNGIPVFVDPELAQAPKNPGRLSFREGYATVKRYLAPALKAAPQVKPVSVGFFGGRLQYFGLQPLQILFVMLVIQAQPDDKRNWDAIRAWAKEVREKMV